MRLPRVSRYFFADRYTYIIGCSCALGISLEDEALIWIAGQRSVNVIDNLIK